MSDEEVYEWIRMIAGRLAKNTPYQAEELIGEGYKGYVSALKHFDASKGYKFKTFAEFRVKGAILDFFRFEQPGKRWVGSGDRPLVFSLEGALEDDSENFSYEVDRALSYTPEDDFHMREVVRTHVDALPTREKEFVLSYFWDDDTMTEVGKKKGVTESRVSQVIAKAVQRLRKKFKTETVINYDKTIFERSSLMGGRRLTQEEIADHVEVIKQAKTRENAATALGVHPATLTNWKAAYPEIADALVEKGFARGKKILTLSPEQHVPAPTSSTSFKQLPVSPDFGFNGTVYLFGRPIAVDISIRAA